MRIEEISPWEAFLGVATHGSFSKAARALKTPVAQVSKRVAKLESQLEVRLFQRTTRVVSLTDEGRVLLPKVHSILADLQEAESLFETKRPLAGLVRITSVPFIAQRLLLPVLAEFMERHPQLRLELDLSETRQDLIHSGFDLAIRIETPKDSNLVYRKLAPNDLIFCAAPGYLTKKAAPLSTPNDLHRHDLLMLDIHGRSTFKNSTLKLAEFAGRRKLLCANGAFLTEMALHEHGVLVRSIWDAQPYLQSGALVQVLKKHPLETFGYIYAVVPTQRFVAPRVRALLEFVVSKSKNWRLK